MDPSNNRRGSVLDSRGKPLERPVNTGPRFVVSLRKTWGLIAAVASVIAVLVAFMADIEIIFSRLFMSNDMSTELAQASAEKEEGLGIHEQGNYSEPLDALHITFADGAEAVVKFEVTSSVLDSNAAVLVSRAGSREVAMRALEPVTESAVFALLEPLTTSDARIRRSALQDSLMVQLRPRYLHFGLTLDALSLTEINVVGK